MTMAYVITEPCIDVKDKACVEVCPVDCIYEGPNQLFIHPDECIDCGACEPVCPVKAIFTEDETPEQSKQFIERQAPSTKLNTPGDDDLAPRPRLGADSIVSCLPRGCLVGAIAGGRKLERIA